MRGARWAGTVGCCLLGIPGVLAAQSAGPLRLARLPEPVTIDGVPREAVWYDLTELPLTQYAPVFRGAPRERTEIRVGYDDTHLYAAGWFYDRDPDGIRIHSLYRDRWNGDDAFALYVDAFNDNQNAKWFGTTPGGIRFDLLVSDDGATLNGSWDAVWEARTSVTEEGWFAEVRIPFSSLGFQADQAGDAVMGLTVTRLVSRTGERVTFPAIDPRFAFRQPSQAHDVLLTDVRSGAPLFLTPFVVAGRNRRPRLDPETGTYDVERSSVGEVGADLRYALTGNVTLDLTANTDFAQVEADEQQVNLDRFSLFFPEKRRFFQEGSGIFDFDAGGVRLFHSRRIGLDENREIVPVIGGARLVGRVGNWDLGLLDMQTDRSGGNAGENFAVARVRRRAFNPYSFLGLVATSRIGGGARAVSLGADAFVRLFGDDYLTLKGAGTFDDREATGDGVLATALLHARVQRRANRGLAYSVDVTRTGPDFRPAVGFLPRRDFTSANLLANWYVFRDEQSRFRRVWPGLLAFSTFRNGDGSLESGRYAVWVQWDTKAGSGGWIEPKLFIDDVASAFDIAGVPIPAGRYRYADLQLALSMPSGRTLRADLDARAGTFFDGTRTQVILKPTWNVSPHLELGADYQFTRLRFADRNEGVDIHLGRLRIRTALDARASGNAFIQYNSTTDRLDVNLRLRYNFAEGTDLWLVYDEGLATERTQDGGLLPRPRSLGRSFVIKYTHTIQ